MQATFSFDVDPDHHLVHIAMGGFFMPDDIARFRRARELAHGKLRCGPNQHVTLIDIRAMQIQSQEAVAEFTRLFDEPRHASRMLAVVVSQSLARLQAQRAAAHRDVRYFQDDIDAARQWLLEQAVATRAFERA